MLDQGSESRGGRLAGPARAEGSRDHGRGVLLWSCCTGGIDHRRSDLSGSHVADPAFTAGSAATPRETSNEGRRSTRISSTKRPDCMQTPSSMTDGARKRGEAVRDDQPDAVVSSPEVVEDADRVARLIMETYVAPNKTFSRPREHCRGPHGRSLRRFSEACREELQAARGSLGSNTGSLRHERRDPVRG